MTSTLSLFDEAEIPREPTDRLFFALFPDVDAAAKIAALAGDLRDTYDLSGRPLATSRFHVTLIHVGDYAGLPKGIVADALAAAAQVEASPFEVKFDHAASFAGRPGNSPFVLRATDGVGEVMGFQRALCVALIKAGVRYRGGEQFTPHVTLLYDEVCVSAQTIEPIRWMAREFVLVHSLLGRTRHIPLGRWSLR